MTKEELLRYRAIDLERKQLEREIRRLEALMTAPTTSSLDGLPKAPGVADPVGQATVKKDTLIKRYRAKVQQLEAEQARIEAAIEALEPMERVLMRHRYIEGMTWEEVCVAIGYSWRQTHRIHAEVLKKIN